MRLATVVMMGLIHLIFLPALAIALPAGATEDDLQDLIDAAKNGDTITINHTIKITKPLSINKSVHIKGAGTLDLQLPLGSPSIALSVTGDNVIIEGLTFDGSNQLAVGPQGELPTTAHYAIRIDNAEHVTVKHCLFQNLTRKGLPYANLPPAEPHNGSLSSEYGIYIQNSSDIHIEDNKFDEISGCAIFAKYSKDLWIKNNLVQMLTTSHSLYPITLYSAITRAVISGNTIRGGVSVSGGAINVMSQDKDCRDLLIKDNIIDKTAGLGSGYGRLRVQSSHNVIIMNNLIVDIPYLEGYTNSAVTYIIVYYNGVRSGAPSSGITITGNLLRMGEPTHKTIDTRNSLNAVVTDNVIIPYDEVLY